MRKGKNTDIEDKELSPCLGFRFTKQEEVCMLRAMWQSKLYMKNYGKGQAPYLVDLSHYENLNRGKI